MRVALLGNFSKYDFRSWCTLHGLVKTILDLTDHKCKIMVGTPFESHDRASLFREVHLRFPQVVGVEFSEVDFPMDSVSHVVVSSYNLRRGQFYGILAEALVTGIGRRVLVGVYPYYEEIDRHYLGLFSSFVPLLEEADPATMVQGIAYAYSSQRETALVVAQSFIDGKSATTRILGEEGLKVDRVSVSYNDLAIVKATGEIDVLLNESGPETVRAVLSSYKRVVLVNSPDTIPMMVSSGVETIYVFDHEDGIVDRDAEYLTRLGLSDGLIEVVPSDEVLSTIIESRFNYFSPIRSWVKDSVQKSQRKLMMALRAALGLE